MCADSRARCITWTGSLPTLSGVDLCIVGGRSECCRSAGTRDSAMSLARRVVQRPRFARVRCGAAPSAHRVMSQRDAISHQARPAGVIAHPGFSDDKLFVPSVHLARRRSWDARQRREIFGRCVYV